MIDPIDGDRLKRAWRALADDATEGSEAAVADDILWRVAAGEGSGEERRTVLDALAIDPATAESWRLAVELQRQLDVGQGVGLSSSPHRRPRRAWASWAAAAALVLAAGLGLLTERGQDPPVYRDPGTAVGTTEAITSEVSESEAVQRHDAVLRWSFSDAGSTDGDTVRYTVRVLTSDLEPLVVLDDLAVSEVRLPGEKLADLDDPARLLWQVEAHTADGRVIVSPTFFIELAPVAGSEGDDGSSAAPTAPTQPSDLDVTPMEP